jgi:tRNA C32,U32 (ribose-2'-O)-methylase TrmJ
MYNLISSNEFVLPTFFCCLLIMLGSYFLLNLMLAVIME